jgi:HSP20 family molecular chaperone IbpA
LNSERILDIFNNWDIIETSLKMKGLVLVGVCCCVLLKVTLALDVNLLESFNLRDGVNGIQQTSASRFDNGFYFAKTHKDVIAVPEVLEEVIDLLTTYKTFIVQFHIQTEPFHKGTLLWIEQKSTGSPLLGIWIRMGTSIKIGIQYHGRRGVESIVFEDKRKYDSPAWKRVVVHFHKTKKGPVADLYLDCQMVGTKKADINIKYAPKTHLEVRLAQREVAGKIFSRYKGSMGSFRLIFRRNITDYIRTQLCTVNDVASNAGAAYDAPRPPPRTPSYRNIFQANNNGNGKENFRQGVRQGPLGYYPSQGNGGDTVAMTNQITTLISRFQNAENGLTGANAIIKEILQTVNSVKAKQDNQIYEMKTLKELMQILSTKQQSELLTISCFLRIL